MREMKLILTALFALALVFPSAFAAGANQSGYYLDVRAAHNACRIDFTTGVIDNVVAKIPNTTSTFSPFSEKLKVDKAKLFEFASAKDKDGFNGFVVGALKTDMQDAASALKSERKKYREYGSKPTDISALREDFQSSRGVFSDCESSAVLKLGQARIAQYGADVANWQSSADKLKEKNLSTAEMQNVIDGAKSGIIAPIQSALDSGNSAELQSALRKYCLGDSCSDRNGAGISNYHGFAKINAARLQAVLNKLLTLDPQNAQLISAQTSLDNVQSILSVVGEGKYAGSQQQDIWNGLKAAKQSVQDYLKTKKGASGQ